MIKLVDKPDVLYSFCRRDPFGTRIAAYHMAYGESMRSIMFWIQFDGDTPVAAVCLADGAVTVCADNNADFAELNEFLSCVGYSSIQCEKSVMERLGFSLFTTGCVVRFVGQKCTDTDAIIGNSEDYKSVYNILHICNFDGIDNYSEWLADISHRCRRGTALIRTASMSGKSVACVSALFITEDSVLLGAVGTLPEYRKQGISPVLVGGLAKEMQESGKRVYLFCKHELIPFYNKVGFEKDGEWAVFK